MPLKAIDYSKTIIYKIVCKDLSITDVYVGHTTGFKDRKSKHKTRCNNYNLKIYKYIRDNGGWNNFDMIQIEEYPCNNVNEAKSRERYWYELLNSKLNMRRPIISDEEKKEQKKEITKIWNKLDYEENKEYYKELNKKKYEENKEHYKELNKKYYEENKECMFERNKIYRHKEYICFCGWIGTNGSKYNHFKKCNQKIKV